MALLTRSFNDLIGSGHYFKVNFQSAHYIIIIIQSFTIARPKRLVLTFLTVILCSRPGMENTPSSTDPPSITTLRTWRVRWASSSYSMTLSSTLTVSWAGGSSCWDWSAGFKTQPSRVASTRTSATWRGPLHFCRTATLSTSTVSSVAKSL